MVEISVKDYFLRPNILFSLCLPFRLTVFSGASLLFFSSVLRLLFHGSRDCQELGPEEEKEMTQCQDIGDMYF